MFISKRLKLRYVPSRFWYSTLRFLKRASTDR
jgi:hypothetical protein